MPSDHPLNKSAFGVRVRIREDNRSVAHVTPLTPIANLSRDPFLGYLGTLQQSGVQQVFTSALRAKDQRFFYDLGFTLHEELLLLGHNFATPLSTPLQPTRRGRRSDRSAILHIDESAFPEFWRFDQSALSEAIKATPKTRIRVNAQYPLAGFAITGRSGRLGFLQRLAVHPQHQRSGLGRSLVADALLWSKRRFVRELLVNTQMENVGARELYESMGFSKKSAGLAVLQWSADT